MEMNSDTKFRNTLWRRVSERLSKGNVARMARAFKETFTQMFVCGRGQPPMNCVIKVPHDISGTLGVKAVVTAAPTEVSGSDGYPRLLKPADNPFDRRKFQTKQQIKMKLFDLEMRFKEQQEIIDKHKKKAQTERVRYQPKLTDEKVRELNAIACEIWRRRSKVDHSKCKLDWDWSKDLRECDE